VKSGFYKTGMVSVRESWCYSPNIIVHYLMLPSHLSILPLIWAKIRYLGDPSHPEVNDYEAEISPDGVIARDISVWQPDPDGSGRGANVTYTYTVVRPLTAYFAKESAGPNFAMFFTVTPVAERTSIAWTYVTKEFENIPDEETKP
jgi:hypothetical protein